MKPLIAFILFCGILRRSGNENNIHILNIETIRISICTTFEAIKVIFFMSTFKFYTHVCELLHTGALHHESPRPELRGQPDTEQLVYEICGGGWLGAFFRPFRIPPHLLRRLHDGCVILVWVEEHKRRSSSFAVDHTGHIC
jgi:hypothetical protein